MIWPEKLYQFTKVQGAVTTYTFMGEKYLLNVQEPIGQYYSNYSQTYYITQQGLPQYYTSLESCYIGWIESIEKFKQKVIKQFENKCKIDYHEYKNPTTEFFDKEADLWDKQKKK